MSDDRPEDETADFEDETARAPDADGGDAHGTPSEPIDETDGTPSVEEGEGEVPLSDLARDVEQRRRREKDDPEETAVADFFTEVEVGDVDSEKVWESVASEAEAGDESASYAENTTELLVESSAAEPVDGAPNEHVVPKSMFCQRCQYFSDPPAFGCTHEGTDILEVVDADRFHVRGCPMIENEADLGEE